MITLAMIVGAVWGLLLTVVRKRRAGEAARLSAADGRMRDMGGRGGF